jgi:hypothetical protein
VQPVLVDGRQFVPEAAVEIFNDPCIALHVRVPYLNVRSAEKFGIALNLAQNACRDKGTF